LPFCTPTRLRLMPLSPRPTPYQGHGQPPVGPEGQPRYATPSTKICDSNSVLLLVRLAPAPSDASWMLSSPRLISYEIVYSLLKNSFQQRSQQCLTACLGGSYSSRCPTLTL
ncbi:hypothetical protein SK128_004959, partial [Halocaridina rubra]